MLRSLLVLLALAAAGPVRAAEMPDWISWDPATKTVKLTVVSGEPPSVNGGWNYNGYASGDLTITVPLGSNVQIEYRNVDQLQHSLVVMDGEKPLPPQDGDPAFARAYTVRLVEGIPPGGGDRVRFKADRAGRYRIFCGVPGHGLAGMWDWFVVSAEAAAPSVSTKREAGPTAPAGDAAPAGHASPHAK